MSFSLWLGYNTNMSYANGIETSLSQSIRAKKFRAI